MKNISKIKSAMIIAGAALTVMIVSIPLITSCSSKPTQLLKDPISVTRAKAQLGFVINENNIKWKNNWFYIMMVDNTVKMQTWLNFLGAGLENYIFNAFVSDKEEDLVDHSIYVGYNRDNLEAPQLGQYTLEGFAINRKTYENLIKHIDNKFDTFWSNKIKGHKVELSFEVIE